MMLPFRAVVVVFRVQLLAPPLVRLLLLASILWVSQTPVGCQKQSSHRKGLTLASGVPSFQGPYTENPEFTAFFSGLFSKKWRTSVEEVFEVASARGGGGGPENLRILKFPGKSGSNGLGRRLMKFRVWPGVARLSSAYCQGLLYGLGVGVCAALRDSGFDVVKR